MFPYLFIIIYSRHYSHIINRYRNNTLC